MASSSAKDTAIPRHIRTASSHWPAVLYGVIALTGCVFAFVGLSSNSFWADELFTLFVVNHHGGLGEVLRRVLSDVHPPLYDFLLYAWMQWFGHGEAAVRLLSALCAVASIAIFALGLRGRVSATAIAFACAVATTSMFWFVQSQNSRDYALAMLISSALLATAVKLQRQMSAGHTFPAGLWIALTLLGVAGGQTHPYMLLTVGMVLLFLILTSRAWPMRMALVASGLLTLALYLALLWLMTRGAEKYDYAITWFSNKPAFFASQLRRVFFNGASRQAILVIVFLLLALGVRRASRRRTVMGVNEKNARWITGLCAFVVVGVIVSGIATSILVAPSFSYRNVLVCAPFGWFLIADLYDRAAPRTDTRVGATLTVAIILLVGSQLVVLMRGRLLPTNESWRASAAYIRGLPGCRDKTLALLVTPNMYGSSMSPAVHEMIERYYYGYYLPANYHLYAYLSGELVQHYASTQTAVDTSGNDCPLIAWGLRDFNDENGAIALAEQFAGAPETVGRPILLQEFVHYELRGLTWKPQAGAFVFQDATPGTRPARVSLAEGTAIDNTRSIGDTLLITIEKPSQGVAARSSYKIQRWRAGKLLDETVTKQN